MVERGFALVPSFDLLPLDHHVKREYRTSSDDLSFCKSLFSFKIPIFERWLRSAKPNNRNIFTIYKTNIEKQSHI